MAQARKYLVMVVVVGVLVWIDWATKMWADQSLASDIHPLPILVTPAESGKTLAELVGMRFPDLAERADLVVKDDVSRVEREVTPDPEANVLSPIQGPAGRRVPVAWLVFHRGTLERSPRSLPLMREKSLLQWWLLNHLGEAQRARVEELVDQAYAEQTLARYVASGVTGMDEAEAAEAIRAGHVLPVLGYGSHASSDTPVAEGDLFLLYDRRVDFIPGLFRFDYKENPGAAWGLLASAGDTFRQLFLSIVSGVAALVILIIFMRLKTSHWSAILAFSAILSGAIGNLIDRVQYNFVIDFFDMYVSYMHWPTYNVADIGITLGVISLVIEMLFVKSSPFAQAGKESLAKDAAKGATA